MSLAQKEIIPIPVFGSDFCTTALHIVEHFIIFINKNTHTSVVVFCNNMMMEELLGSELLAAPGAVTPIRDVLDGTELVMLYFSASW